MVWFRVLVVIATLVIAGCTAAPEDAPAPSPHRLVGDVPADVQAGLQRLASARADPLVIERPFTVHVVAVGWDLGLLDQEAVRAALPHDLSPRIEFGPSLPDGLRGGLLHQVEYAFHEAPQAFTEELFAVYPDVSEEVPIPGGENGFLARYDALYELGRAQSGRMRLVDVQAVEEHIETLRTAHGLRFDGPHATVFLLDSWTEERLWEDQYYWYAFHDDYSQHAETRNLRAWGGTYDFLFLDRSAAPNDAKTDRSGMTTAYYVLGSQPVYAAEGTAYHDPPAWHYTGDTAVVGKGALEHRVTLEEAIIGALDPAVNVRILNDYIFRPAYAERYHVGVHLWHDGRSRIPQDLDALLNGDVIRTSMQEAVPWVDVEVTVDTYVAPHDDPDMDAAMQRAKQEGAGMQLAMPVLLNFVDANAERFKRDERGTLDFIALGFVLEGQYAVVVPFMPGGAAVTGPDRTCWGGTSSVNDAYYVQTGLSVEAMEQRMTTTLAHELGHCFGLPHAHDGTRRTADGYESALDHTWSSTNTTMSYRVQTSGVDHFHRTSIARAHVLDNLGRVERDLDWAFRALDAQGHVKVPKDVLALLREAGGAADDAMHLYQEGKDLEAVFRAVEAKDLAHAAATAAGVMEEEIVEVSWSASGVHSVGRKNSAFVFRPGVAAPEVQYDYRPVPLGEDAEQVTVRATWTNTPSSWGDFFIGWRAPDILDPTFVDLGPAGRSVSLGLGIHDEVDEGPQDGQVTRSFTLDLDQFPALREEGVRFEAGAGTQGAAMNGAYEVEIVVERRSTPTGSPS